MFSHINQYFPTYANVFPHKPMYSQMKHYAKSRRTGGRNFRFLGFSSFQIELFKIFPPLLTSIFLSHSNGYRELDRTISFSQNTLKVKVYLIDIQISLRYSPNSSPAHKQTNINNIQTNTQTCIDNIHTNKNIQIEITYKQINIKLICIKQHSMPNTQTSIYK